MTLVKGGENVNRSSKMLRFVLGTVLLVAPPAFAKTHHAVSCSRIQQSLSSGKSADDVAKQFKVPVSRVNACTSHTASSHGGMAAKSQPTK
jgi:hypothetical protein